MTTAKTQLLTLFGTPVITERWPDAAVHNDALRQAIADRQRNDGGVSLSNVLGWQSDDRMPDWGGEAAKALLTHAVERCSEMTADRQANRRQLRWITNMWGNVSEAGASNQTHSHPGAYWSAVYYVDDGSGGKTDPVAGGELVFLDPRMPMVRARTPDLRVVRPDGSRDHHESWLTPTTGLLLFFPAWLMHNVRPYHGKGSRISIAMNMTPDFGNLG